MIDIRWRWRGIKETERSGIELQWINKINNWERNSIGKKGRNQKQKSSENKEGWFGVLIDYYSKEGGESKVLWIESPSSTFWGKTREISIPVQ